MLWKLELEEDFFRIFDSKKTIAGYFDPDYGDIYPKKNFAEIASGMIKNHEKIMGGAIMVPLVKFRLFDTDLNASLLEVEQNVTRVNTHIQKWKDYLSQTSHTAHTVRISHSDQDMLTITFHIKFTEPTPLERTELAKQIAPTLDLLQRLGLL